MPEPATPAESVDIIPRSAYITPTIALRELRAYTQHVTGRLKTIIDAAIPDGRQNRGLKDLIHNAMWFEHYERVRAWAERQVVNIDCEEKDATNIIREVFPFVDAMKLPQQPAEVIAD